MSEYTMSVKRAVTVEIDYEEFNLDHDQAMELIAALADALGVQIVQPL